LAQYLRIAASRRMVKLSRDQAVSLLDELHEVVMKLRILEAKYDLEDHSETPTGLGVNLLAALRQYGQDPEVLGKAARAGLKLLPITSPLAPAMSMQRSQDNISEMSTAWGTRMTTEATLQSERPGSEDLDWNPEVGRKLIVVPALSCTPGQRTFFVEHRRDASVKELRKQLAASMQMPLGKMRVLAEVDGEAVTMADHESAEHASVLFVRTTAAHFQSAGVVNMGKFCTLEQCLQMHMDVLHSLSGARQPVSAECLKQIQTSVLSRYGFNSSASGMAALLHALDQYVGNAEVRRCVDQINQTMGFQPQVYNLQVHV